MVRQLLLIFLSQSTYILFSCSYATQQYASPDGYDLNHPERINLPTELDEISGIIYYPKDTAVFAISDETGSLYKIFPDQNAKVEKWKFGKNHDFEDLQLVDSNFYILSSSGDITVVQFVNDSAKAQQFDFEKKGKDEFETLYYDPATKLLNIMCKNCSSDKKHETSIYTFDPATNTFNYSRTVFDISDIQKQLNKKDAPLRPSAAALNPLDGKLYILSSINKMLLVTDKKGETKKIYHLNGDVYNQPEGIAFTNKGDLLISNEAAKDDAPNILIIKRKKGS